MIVVDGLMVQPVSGWVAVCRRPGSLRAVAMVLAVVLAAYLVGSGAASSVSGTVPWSAARPAPVAAPAAGVVPGATSAPAAGVDAGRVVETVSHHVAVDPLRPGVLVAEDPAYVASFDPSGFALGDPGGAGEGFALSLSGLARGADPISVAPAAWGSEANVASRGVASDVTERVTARNGAVEWDLVLGAEPSGRGDLAVRAEVSSADSAHVGDLSVVMPPGRRCSGRRRRWRPVIWRWSCPMGCCTEPPTRSRWTPLCRLRGPCPPSALQGTRPDRGWPSTAPTTWSCGPTHAPVRPRTSTGPG